MKKDMIAVFKDTLKIAKKGYYIYENKKKELKLSALDRTEVELFPPERVKAIVEHKVSQSVPFTTGRMGVSISDRDSFDAAIHMSNDYLVQSSKSPKVLVLNFANPIYPGGDIKNETNTQEAALCRRSTLYVSLSSKQSEKMYTYHSKLGSCLASDYMLLSPNVEIIRDLDGNFLPETSIVSVLSVAAPQAHQDIAMEMEQEEWNALLSQRIKGILHVAAYCGYKHIILGAWGCGTFGNDANNMARLFYQELKNFKVQVEKKDLVHTARDFFSKIEFAVLKRDKKESYHYDCFAKYFSDFYAEEHKKISDCIAQEKKSKEIWLDAIRGSLFGGAAGDALGYPIEFLSKEQIQEIYGTDGITGYEYDSVTGKALLSDDTQMTLFTATGLLFGITRGRMRGIMASLENYIWLAYRNWCEMQSGIIPKDRFTWLCDIPELGQVRAPGTTCISAIMSGRQGTIAEPINHSKGCGGIMRIAPIGMYLNRYPQEKDKIQQVDGLAALVAALTHGHELGYMPAAALAHIINRIIYGGCKIGNSLESIVREAIETMQEMYQEKQYLKDLCSLMDKAIILSHNGKEDIQNIQELGEGWVAEETLAIALYCSLKYQDDFSKALCVSVNHSGDSDSTGAVTGNILGALWGYEKIPSQWKDNLECNTILLEIADDLCYDCLMSEYGDYEDLEWIRKYIECNSNTTLIQ